MSLADPTRKMSKSDPNPKGTVYLTDEPNVIMKKFKSAVTDSEMSVRYAEGKDGINNLMSIYSAVTGKDFDTIESEFAGKGYGDKAYLKEKWTQGAELAQRVSQRTLDKVMKKVGFVLK